MNATTQKLIYVGLVLALVTAAWGLEYSYLTHTELDPYGFSQRWQIGDTVWGRVHCNWSLNLSGGVFYDLVTSAGTVYIDSLNPPVFHGPEPMSGVPEVRLPEDAALLRTEAQRQGHFYDHGWSRTMLIEIRLDSLRLYEWRTGCPIDCTNYEDVSLDDGLNAYYFNCPLRIHGVLRGQLSVGCSYDVRIEKDIRYVDSDVRGRVAATSSNYFALASSRDIKIGNTPANGRENCNGGGRYNPNQNQCGIIVCGAYYAFDESFTLENQNDGGDSGYVCDCSPDERGFIRLFGAIVQARRGYLHRDTQGGTGYQKDFRYDARFLLWDDLVWPYALPPANDTIDFGDVIVNRTALDTVIYPSYGVIPGHVNYPFQWHQYFQRPETTFIPVSFTPPNVQAYGSVFPIYVGYRTFNITLMGRGIEDTSSVPGIVAEDAPTR